MQYVLLSRFERSKMTKKGAFNLADTDGEWQSEDGRVKCFIISPNDQDKDGNYVPLVHFIYQSPITILH